MVRGCPFQAFEYLQATLTHPNNLEATELILERFEGIGENGQTENWEDAIVLAIEPEAGGLSRDSL